MANIYRPVNITKKSGGSGAHTIQGGGSPSPIATKFAKTATVKKIDSQQ
jgi:hypothetical protein